ncbi:hypothetical protein P3T18_000674 [Paraburkholderia sp. GAS199]|uniref:DUF3331 domain-containing protein n=1 Tax=Paraburkholderia sp. GAS199 TaxID=3035126 RepID=UPI003D203B22
MELRSDQSDPWVRVLSALGDLSRSHGSSLQLALKSEDKASAANTCRSPLPARDISFSPYVTINVLECADGVAIVEWKDPTGGHYAEQRWHRCMSRRTGVCVLSGSVIVRGDCVFRPARRSREPMNSNAMILASVLAGVCGV